VTATPALPPGVATNAPRPEDGKPTAEAHAPQAGSVDSAFAVTGRDASRAPAAADAAQVCGRHLGWPRQLAARGSRLARSLSTRAARLLRRPPLWLRLLVSLALVAAAIHLLDPASVAQRIGRIDPALAALAVATATAGQALCGLRWHQLALALGMPDRAGAGRAFVHAYLRGCLWNNVLPSGYGGDAVKVAWLAPRSGMRTAAASVALDRALGFLALTAVAAISLPASGYGLPAPLTWTAAGLGIVALAAATFAPRQGARWWRQRRSSSSSSAVAGLGRAPYWRLAVVLSLIYVLVWSLATALLARALGVDLAPAAVPTVVAVTGVAMALPVAIGGVGTREAGFVAALAPLGVATHDAVALGIAFGALLATSALVGALPALGTPKRATTSAARPRLPLLRFSWLPGLLADRRLLPVGRRVRRPITPARRDALFLAALLVGGLALRLVLARRSLWLDETITYAQVARSPGEIVKLQLAGVHPPLYHLQAGLTVSLLGSSELALRTPSIAWSLVGVVAVWWWARAALSRRAARWAALLAAIAPFAVWYGSEARMYAQVFALVALAGALAWRLLERGGWLRATALALTMCALAYTHYFGALFAAALGLVAAVLAATRADLRKRALAVLACLALAALSLVPWVLVAFLGRDATSQLPPYNRPDPFAVIIAIVELVGGFHDYRAVGLAAATWPLALLALLVAVPRLARVPVSVGALMTLVLLPVALLVAASWLGPHSVFDPRYLTVIAPPLFLLIGALLARVERALPGGVRATAAAVCAGLFVALSLIQGHDRGNPRLFQLREALRAAARATAPGDALALVPQFQVTKLRYDPVLAYYRPPRSRRVIDTLEGPGRKPRDAWLIAQRSGSRRIALVTTFEGQALAQQLASPSRFVRAFRSYGPLLEKRSFAGVQVRVYALQRTATHPVRRGVRAAHRTTDRKEAI
jgi:uncharacterized membrane protein YbhN (UPF0104 family)